MYQVNVKTNEIMCGTNWYVSWQPHVEPYIKFINKKDLTSVMLNNLPATETWGLKQKELDELNGDII